MMPHGIRFHNLNNIRIYTNLNNYNATGEVGGAKKVVISFRKVFQNPEWKPFQHLFEATISYRFPILFYLYILLV